MGNSESEPETPPHETTKMEKDLRTTSPKEERPEQLNKKEKEDREKKKEKKDTSENISRSNTEQNKKEKDRKEIRKYNSRPKKAGRYRPYRMSSWESKPPYMQPGRYIPPPPPPTPYFPGPYGIPLHYAQPGAYLPPPPYLPDPYNGQQQPGVYRHY